MLKLLELFNISLYTNIVREAWKKPWSDHIVDQLLYSHVVQLSWSHVTGKSCAENA